MAENTPKGTLKTAYTFNGDLLVGLEPPYASQADVISAEFPEYYVMNGDNRSSVVGEEDLDPLKTLPAKAIYYFAKLRRKPEADLEEVKRRFVEAYAEIADRINYEYDGVLHVLTEASSKTT